jgi:hypothetical protein
MITDHRPNAGAHTPGTVGSAPAARNTELTYQLLLCEYHRYGCPAWGYAAWLIVSAERLTIDVLPQITESVRKACCVALVMSCNDPR